MPPRKKAKDIFGDFKDAVKPKFPGFNASGFKIRSYTVTDLQDEGMDGLRLRGTVFLQPWRNSLKKWNEPFKEHLKGSFHFFNAHQVPGFGDWWVNHADEIRDAIVDLRKYEEPWRWIGSPSLDGKYAWHPAPTPGRRAGLRPTPRRCRISSRVEVTSAPGD